MEEVREFRARVTVDGHSATSPGDVRVDALGVRCEAGPSGALGFEYVDAAVLLRGDLAVTVKLFDGREVRFDKGGSLDDLWETLRGQFFARVSSSLRFAPSDANHRFDARVTLEGRGGLGSLPGRVSVVRLGINYLTEAGPCAQLPFGALGEPVFDAASYEVRIPLTTAVFPGGLLKIGKLARRTDEFVSVLNEARAKSLADTARCLKKCLPALSKDACDGLCNELLVGKMASMERCEAAAKGAWKALWSAAAGQDREPYRDVLESMSGEHQLFIGMRPYGGAPPSANGEEETSRDSADGPADGSSENSERPILYAVAVLPGTSPEQDLLALEVLSERDHATYLYRFAPGSERLSREDRGARLAEIASHMLLSINFAKEPLYLPEKEALSVRDGLYRAALRRLENLREMRGLFLGRAVHSSVAAWKAQIEKLRAASNP